MGNRRRLISMNIMFTRNELDLILRMCDWTKGSGDSGITKMQNSITRKVTAQLKIWREAD